MPGRRKVTDIIFGAPLDPFSKETRRHVVLVAFLAWIGLGADGLSSSCYGPEEAFLALGENRQLGVYTDCSFRPRFGGDFGDSRRDDGREVH
jgi:hypothetical protein